jgi:3-keto-disaccharide hydrolase
MSHHFWGTAWLAATLVTLLAAEKAIIHTFDQQPEGRVPAGWTSAKTGEGEGSVWKVVGYDEGGQKGRALAQTSSEGPNGLFNLCVVEGARYGDVDLSVRVKAVSGKNDRGGGVVWRYRDANNYYVTRWNPLEDNLRVYHVVNGKRTQLATADVKAAADAWHVVRAVQHGDHIECYLDDKRLLDVHDATITGAGGVGLWSKSDAVSWFDDFRISAPEGE